MTTLVLIRHGNTFDANDVLLRVGARTDLPLSLSGQEQADRLGAHLRAKKLLPGLVLTSRLQRTQQTAALALAAADHDAPVQVRVDLDEIDYGPDDGKPETEVIAGLGPQALEAWESKGIMPAGWSPRPGQIETGVQALLEELERAATVWAVTSNGIARYFGQAAGRWDCERPGTLKLATAHYALLRHDGNAWRVAAWNVNC